ncbi:hypothetical protein MMC07_004916 [Pseudocyphellaria aurata]|nr:hypothetical protein [Pseudocyphellaria aurata]
MAVEVTLNTPLAEALSEVVQPKLSEIGWNTGGLDDSALGEYIILMLVNGKTQDQIAAELSNDLLNLEPENSGAIDFSRWLFEQVDLLSTQLNGTSVSRSTPAPGAQVLSSHPELRGSPERGGKMAGSGGSPDGEMAEAMEGVLDGVIPTEPKSMRNGSRNGNRRLMGQLSKAMDRSSDAVLHRIRPQQGTERINVHNRQPPKGPRNDSARNQRLPQNGRPMGMANGGMHNGVHGANGVHGVHGIHGGLNMQMTPQQQMQLFAMYEEQARMMSQIFSPQQQQVFMPRMSQPAMNPMFQSGSHHLTQQPGRSLFDRVENNPHRQNGASIRSQQQNGGPSQAKVQSNPIMSAEIHHPSTNGDVSSSMEVEISEPNTAHPSTDTVCKYNLACTRKDCISAHQSPAAPPGTTIDVNDHCPFGAACKNRKCVARHPSPSQKANHQGEQDCRFFPNCTNVSCPFRHPTMPMCRNGADCTREGCMFTHVKIMCKFNPCLNPTCPYKHVEGQKRGVFDDKVWVAEDGQEKEHVSERKFVDDEMVEEELIVPENQADGSRRSSVGAEVVT